MTRKTVKDAVSPEDGTKIEKIGRNKQNVNYVQSENISRLILSTHYIEQRIFIFRGVQVMLDRDLAELYDVGTKVLNQAVKRNLERFPEAFRFQLDQAEKNELVTSCDRLANLKYAPTCPFVFTEQGVAMLSAVLRSKTAVEVSIHIMQTFVETRKFISSQAGLFQRLEKVEKKQLETDQKFECIFSALEDKTLIHSQGIFYDGEIFDAYIFVIKLIKNAKTSIVLIDNYIDETVLLMLSKRSKAVKVTIYTSKITNTLQHDLEKHNSQYAPVTVKIFRKAHDRFLVIDTKTVYHIGASLKDVGKKWFAFSKINLDAKEMIKRIETEGEHE